jgi:hypothetical protein
MARSGTLSVRGPLIVREELACIAMAMHNADPEMGVTIRAPTSMAEDSHALQLVELTQVIDVTLHFVAGYSVSKVLDAIVTQAHKGWQTLWSCAAVPGLVSRKVNIYGPSGEVLRRVTIKEDRIEGEDRPVA